MKKIVFLTMATLIIGGCSNEKEEDTIKPNTPQEVTVTFDYSLWESGSMTRSTGSDLYTNFYDKYVKTKLLTPTSYSLSIGNKEMTKYTTIDGYWKSKDGIRLIEGTYDISGISKPGYTYNHVDSLALTFNEKVVITKETTAITLRANYLSYMLMFDANNIKSIEYSEYTNNGPYKTYNLKKADNIFYVFINQKPGASDKIIITRKNNSIITINPYGLSFEKGKYYYFNDVTNSFDIPPMVGGN